MCLGSIAFCVIGGWLVNDHPSERAVIVGWAALAFSSLAGVMWAFQLIWPSRLLLDGDGLAFHYLFATFRRRWINVARIEVVQIRSTRFVKLIAKDGGKDLLLGGAWPVSASELFSLMESYLTRYGKTNGA